MEYDKSRVYTGLTADEVYVGSKGYFGDCLASIKRQLQANLDPEELVHVDNENSRDRFIVNRDGIMAYALFYKIEDSVKDAYRPYETQEELVNDFKARVKAYGAGFQKCPMFNPLIWIQNEEDGQMYSITGFADDCVKLPGNNYIAFSELFKNWTYLDGSVVGLKI